MIIKIPVNQINKSSYSFANGFLKKDIKNIIIGYSGDLQDLDLSECRYGVSAGGGILFMGGFKFGVNLLKTPLPGSHIVFDIEMCIMNFRYTNGNGSLYIYIEEYKELNREIHYRFDNNNFLRVIGGRCGIANTPDEILDYGMESDVDVQELTFTIDGLIRRDVKIGTYDIDPIDFTSISKIISKLVSKNYDATRFRRTRIYNPIEFEYGADFVQITLYNVCDTISDIELVTDQRIDKIVMSRKNVLNSESISKIIPFERRFSNGKFINTLIDYKSNYQMRIVGHYDIKLILYTSVDIARLGAIDLNCFVYCYQAEYRRSMSNGVKYGFIDGIDLDTSSIRTELIGSE